MKLPTLYTERLMIRPLSVLDADDMYEYAKTPLVGPMAIQNLILLLELQKIIH